jgi:hypothetical protein
MSARRVEITLSEPVWDRLESARGHEPRASFIKRALDTALSGQATYSRKDIEAAEFKPADSATFSKPTTTKRSQHVPGVKTARELAMERQRKMNERKS